jgi:pimeloyl-ACP methyl ester carboxylesterase
MIKEVSRDLVLIHSTGQGRAGWDRVVQALARRGRRAHAVQLPSDQPELLAADYADIIRAEVGELSEPVVVAHSGSGALLAAASSALGAVHQVWLAAWVPDPGASFLEEVADHGRSAFNPDWIGQDPIANDDVAERFLYHDCDRATLEWALRTRRLFVPLGVYRERIDPDNGVPSTYIVATGDRTIRPDWQRFMARERLGVEPVEIDSGHCPNVSQPEALAAILAEASSDAPA